MREGLGEGGGGEGGDKGQVEDCKKKEKGGIVESDEE